MCQKNHSPTFFFQFLISKCLFTCCHLLPNSLVHFSYIGLLSWNRFIKRYYIHILIFRRKAKILKLNSETAKREYQKSTKWSLKNQLNEKWIAVLNPVLNGVRRKNLRHSFFKEARALFIKHISPGLRHPKL